MKPKDSVYRKMYVRTLLKSGVVPVPRRSGAQANTRRRRRQLAVKAAHYLAAIASVSTPCASERMVGIVLNLSNSANQRYSTIRSMGVLDAPSLRNFSPSD